MKYVILWVAAFFLLTGCSSENSKRNVELKKNLSKVLTADELNDAQYCIVVPSAGCTGCIEDASLYLKQKIDSIKDVQVIFTGVHDKKLLFLNLGSDFFDRNNVHLDTGKVFQNFEVKSNYPQVIFMKSGEPEEVRELDVNERDMDKLLKRD
jgi:hypothetical protein